jgi:DedD protein
MDPALKQRLIGAAVFVALIVIFLPMLLDRPREPEPRSLQLTIPQAPDRRLETRVIEVEPDARRDPGPLPAQQAAREEPVVGERAEVAPRVDALTGEDTAGRGAPAGGSPPQATPRDAAGAAAASPGPQPGNGRAEPAPEPAAEGRWMVGFGSFAQRGNAEKLAAELRRQGFEPVLDEVESGGRRLTRVRAGPFALRAEAERARLAGAALPGVEARIQELPVPAAAAGRAAPAAGFAVQVGVFSREDNANALRDRLRGAGFSAWVERVSGENPAWRVRVGPEADRASAERLRRALSERMALQGMIVAHP